MCKSLFLNLKAFESSSYAMILMSADGTGKLLSWNKAFVALLEGKEDFNLKYIYEVLDREDWEKSQKIHLQYLKSGLKSYNLKLNYRKVTGEFTTIVSHNDILYDVDSNQPLFCLSIMTPKQ